MLQELVEIEKRMTADLERRQYQYKRRSDEGEGDRTLDQVCVLSCTGQSTVDHMTHDTT